MNGTRKKWGLSVQMNESVSGKSYLKNVPSFPTAYPSLLTEGSASPMGLLLTIKLGLAKLFKWSWLPMLEFLREVCKSPMG